MTFGFGKLFILQELMGSLPCSYDASKNVIFIGLAKHFPSLKIKYNTDKA